MSLREGSHLRNKSSWLLGTEGSGGMVTWAFSIMPAMSCMVFCEVASRLRTGTVLRERSCTGARVRGRGLASVLTHESIGCILMNSLRSRSSRLYSSDGSMPEASDSSSAVLLALEDCPLGTSGTGAFCEEFRTTAGGRLISGGMLTAAWEASIGDLANAAAARDGEMCCACPPMAGDSVGLSSPVG